VIPFEKDLIHGFRTHLLILKKNSASEVQYGPISYQIKSISLSQKQQPCVMYTGRLISWMSLNIEVISEKLLE